MIKTIEIFFAILTLLVTNNTTNEDYIYFKTYTEFKKHLNRESVTLNAFGIQKVSDKDNYYIVRAEDSWGWGEWGDWYLIHSGENGNMKFALLGNGPRGTPEPKEVNITQGVFVIGYQVGHMGSGSLYFHSIEEPYNAKYIINGAYDINHEYKPVELTKKILDEEDWAVLPDEKILSKISLVKGRIKSASISKIFSGGALTPYFEDINSDGHTDIILHGVQLEKLQVETDDNRYEFIVNESLCKRVYIYDADSDDFILTNTDM